MKFSREQAKRIEGAICLIGIGVFFLLDIPWWPSILILIGLTMVVETALPKEEKPPVVPHRSGSDVIDVDEVVEEEVGDEFEADLAESEPVPPPLEETPPGVHHSALLPGNCPACGGPIRGIAQDVKWAGDSHVICPFCGANVPVSE